MRLPRPRLKLRWLMVAVAVISVLLGITILAWRRFEYLRRAEYWRREASPPASFLPSFGKGEEVVKREIAEFKAARERDLLTPRGQHFLRLARKYERAARYPWLPVEPDPPEPSE